APARRAMRRRGCAPASLGYRPATRQPGAFTMIRIGANPIGWSNDDMVELGGDIPLEQCLAEAKAAGFQGMELGNKFPREAGKLRPILDAHGLALVSGWYSTFLLQRDAQA